MIQPLQGLSSYFPVTWDYPGRTTWSFLHQKHVDVGSRCAIQSLCVCKCSFMYVCLHFTPMHRFLLFLPILFSLLVKACNYTTFPVSSNSQTSESLIISCNQFLQGLWVFSKSAGVFSQEKARRVLGCTLCSSDRGLKCNSWCWKPLRWEQLEPGRESHGISISCLCDSCLLFQAAVGGSCQEQGVVVGWTLGVAQHSPSMMVLIYA